MCSPCRPADVGRLFWILGKHGTVWLFVSKLSRFGRCPTFRTQTSAVRTQIGEAFHFRTRTTRIHTHTGVAFHFSHANFPDSYANTKCKARKPLKAPPKCAGLYQQSVSCLCAFCFECGHNAVVRFCDFLVRERAFRIQIGQRECDRLHAFFHPLSFIHVKDADFF